MEMLTAERLAADPRYRRCELWDGIPVVKAPSGWFSSFVGANLCGMLWQHVRERRIGWVGGADVGFLLRRAPDRLLSPDIAFVSFATLASPPRAAFAECVPDFVGEVQSPSDSRRELIQKCLIWASHGVPVVWMVEPVRRSVLAFRPDWAPEEYAAGSRVGAVPSLPEFEIAVDDLFVPPGGRA